MNTQISPFNPIKTSPNAISHSLIACAAISALAASSFGGCNRFAPKPILTIYSAKPPG